jgi:hypothetical protein
MGSGAGGGAGSARSVGVGPACRLDPVGYGGGGTGGFAPARASRTGPTLTTDPVVDGVTSTAALAFSGILGWVLSTGEVRPPEPEAKTSSLCSSTASPSRRGSILTPSLTRTSGFCSAVAFATLDPILSGFRDGTDAMLVDTLLYAESGSITLTLSEIIKIAIRRPRPFHYKNCQPSPTGPYPPAARPPTWVSQ